VAAGAVHQRAGPVAAAAAAEPHTPRINRLASVLGYLRDISRIGQGYDQVLDIPGVSFEVFGISLGYPKSRKDIPKSHLEGCLMVYTTFGWHIPCSNWYIPYDIPYGIYHMIYTMVYIIQK
jgi:hypothetical protein